MLKIPNVTLCCIDCDNHLLSLEAIKRSIQLCQFENVLFLTDRKFNIKDISVKTIKPLKSTEDYSLFIMRNLHNYIKTDFVLLIQYDGFII